jgi:hypothetical protein
VVGANGCAADLEALFANEMGIGGRGLERGRCTESDIWPPRATLPYSAAPSLSCRPLEGGAPPRSLACCASIELASITGWPDKAGVETPLDHCGGSYPSV